MALVLFWMAGLATVAGATVFALSARPIWRIAGMGGAVVGTLLLLIFWQAPALFCLAFLIGLSSCLALFIFSIRLFPVSDSLLSPVWGRHAVAVLAIWGFSFAIQRGMARIPVGAFRTSILAPDSDSLFFSFTGVQSGLILLLFLVFVFFGTGIKRLRSNHPLGGNDGFSS